jgi:hypothetical protein
MRQQRGDHETERDAGGPGSSHQGGSHGRAHRPRDDEKDPSPNAPTNTTRSGVSGGGGERDRHHTHDQDKRA